MPPAALIRSTSISITFFSGRPRLDCAPVSDSTTPIVYGDLSASVPPLSVSFFAQPTGSIPATTTATAQATATHVPLYLMTCLPRPR